MRIFGLTLTLLIFWLIFSLILLSLKTTSWLRKTLHPHLPFHPLRHLEILIMFLYYGVKLYSNKYREISSFPVIECSCIEQGWPKAREECFDLDALVGKSGRGWSRKTSLVDQRDVARDQSALPKTSRATSLLPLFLYRPRPTATSRDH